jgi:hypothetical protein
VVDFLILFCNYSVKLPLLLANYFRNDLYYLNLYSWKCFEIFTNTHETYWDVPDNTLGYGMALSICIHLIVDSSSFESEPESDFEMDHEWEPDSSKAEIEVSSENMDHGISNVEIFEHRVSEDEVQILEPPLSSWLT